MACKNKNFEYMIKDKGEGISYKSQNTFKGLIFQLDT